MTAPDHDAARWGATPPGYEATNRTSAAPDHEPICGPSCTPDCGMGHCYLENGPYPEHAHKLNNQANEHAANELLTTPKLAADDLRDRIAEALIDDFRQRHGEPDQIIRAAKHRTATLAMTVVQPALDAKDAEIAELRQQYDSNMRHMTDGLKTNLAKIADLRKQLAQARADLGRYDHYATQIGAKELDT